MHCFVEYLKHIAIVGCHQSSTRAAASVSWLASSERLGSHDFKLGGEWFEESDPWGGSVSPTDLEFLADYLADEQGHPIYDEQGRIARAMTSLVVLRSPRYTHAAQ